MIERIWHELTGLTGLSISIGVVGFLSGIVTMFVNVNEQISVKWLLFSILAGTVIIFVVLKVAYDLSQETKPPAMFEHPIQYLKDAQIFVIRRNENFANNILVGCYQKVGEVERLAYVGVVDHFQDKVIQIKIRLDCKLIEVPPESPELLGKIFIRPVVPITALEQFASSEKTNV